MQIAKLHNDKIVLDEFFKLIKLGHLFYKVHLASDIFSLFSQVTVASFNCFNVWFSDQDNRIYLYRKKKSRNIHLFHLKTIHIKFMHNDHQKFFQKLLAIGLLLQLMDYVLLKVTLKYYKINTNYRAITKFQKRAWL